MDEKIVERVLKQHETRLVLLTNRVSWLEKRLDGLRVEQDGRLKRLV